MDRILNKFDWMNRLCYLPIHLRGYLRDKVNNVPRYNGNVNDVYLCRVNGNVCIYVQCSEKLPINKFEGYMIIEELV